MEMHLKRFYELTGSEMYEILKERSEVFVVEQTCIYQDIDDKDKLSYHLFIEENGETAAYLRILPKGVAFNETAIGRVLVKTKYRHCGLARKLMTEAISFIKNELHESEIRISAQCYLIKFYQSLGFVQTSEQYLEDGIPHMEMLLKF